MWLAVSPLVVIVDDLQGSAEKLRVYLSFKYMPRACFSPVSCTILYFIRSSAVGCDLFFPFFFLHLLDPHLTLSAVLSYCLTMIMSTPRCVFAQFE